MTLRPKEGEMSDVDPAALAAALRLTCDPDAFIRPCGRCIACQAADALDRLQRERDEARAERDAAQGLLQWTPADDRNMTLLLKVAEPEAALAEARGEYNTAVLEQAEAEGMRLKDALAGHDAYQAGARAREADQPVTSNPHPEAGTTRPPIGGGIVAKNLVHLKTWDGQHFLCAEEGGGNQGERIDVAPGKSRPKGLLTATRTVFRAWETFEAVPVGKDRVALRSCHDRFVCAEEGGGTDADGNPQPVVANRTAVLGWETFQVVPGERKNGVQGVGLKSDGGYYLAAEEGGGGAVTATRRYVDPGPWETFFPSAPLLAVPGPLPQQRRTGRVRLDNRCYKDAGGPYLALGATVMYAAWAWKHSDRARLKKNLLYLSDRGVDFVRYLGAVDWPNQVIDPNWPDYRQVILDLTRFTYEECGMRVEWTLTGTHTMDFDPDRLMAHYVDLAERQPEALQCLEVANESWQCYPDAALVRRMGSFLQLAVGSLPVALSAAEGGNPQATADLYAGSKATLVMIHPDRGMDTGDGPWRPVRQGWIITEMSGLGLPAARQFNEPVGPETSVAAETNPLRLVMAGVVCWLSGGCGYVYHTGAGVAGWGPAQGPIGRARAADFWDVENIEATLAGFRAVRSILPGPLPNGTRANHYWDAPLPPHPCKPIDRVGDGRDGDHGCVRCFGNTLPDGTWWTAPIGIYGWGLKLHPRAASHLTVYRPLDASVFLERDFRAGEELLLRPADGEAFIIQGKPL